MKWTSYRHKVLMAIVVISMSVSLSSCGILGKRPKTTKVQRVESGVKGVEPALWTEVDWVCGDRNAYRLELK